MGTTTRRRLLVAVLVAQVAVLLGIAALHGVRVSDGTRVRLEVVPVDPLDLARGAYVELRYGTFEGLAVPRGLDDGDEVYVELRRPSDPDGAWTAGAVAASQDDLEDPDAFIRLHVEDRAIGTDEIGTFYASADDAKRLQSDLADGGIAEVVLGSDGDPLLDDVR